MWAASFGDKKVIDSKKKRGRQVFFRLRDLYGKVLMFLRTANEDLSKKKRAKKQSKTKDGKIERMIWINHVRAPKSSTDKT